MKLKKNKNSYHFVPDGCQEVFVDLVEVCQVSFDPFNLQVGVFRPQIQVLLHLIEKVTLRSYRLGLSILFC